MTKSEATSLFGNQKTMLEALDLSREGFRKWTDPLTSKQADRVRGAYLRIAEERDRLLVHKIGEK